jgi:hypothetical protein
MAVDDAEIQRRDQAAWRRWGPYVSERAWGTVREDYSADGDAWTFFPHDHARSRAYRWSEDGLGGICDERQLLCLAVAFWNGRDPILKERIFGLTGHEGNHGEDCKEYWWYLDSAPTQPVRVLGLGSDRGGGGLRARGVDHGDVRRQLELAGRSGSRSTTWSSPPSSATRAGSAMSCASSFRSTRGGGSRSPRSPWSWRSASCRSSSRVRTVAGPSSRPRALPARPRVA